MNGKGGGKPESAQASGNNVSVLAEAIRIATEYGNSKLGLGPAPSAAPQASKPTPASAPQASKPAAAGAFSVSFDPQAPLSRMIQAVAAMSGKQVTLTPAPAGSPLTLTLADKSQLSGVTAVATFLASDQLKGGTDHLAKSQVLQWLYFTQNHLIPYVSATKGKVPVSFE